ncbi:hypothetical protein [uncultured Oscillibacter sp.]|uniref:hypothetical protein n=1 Tax=uncultured Oscillibacter sp. TaxID=876091 RepID=UPI00266EFD36|nr:hypothetical protein [uncultured Oscillibacter sp.]
MTVKNICDTPVMANKSYHGAMMMQAFFLKVVFQVTRENENIRRAARIAGVTLWAIAVKLGVSEPTLTRWLRVQLSVEKEAKIRAAIAALEQEAE